MVFHLPHFLVLIPDFAKLQVRVAVDVKVQVHENQENGNQNIIDADLTILENQQMDKRQNYKSSRNAQSDVHFRVLLHLPYQEPFQEIVA